MKLKVCSLVSQGEVVLRQFGFGGVKGQLVARQPALVAQHGRGTDSGTGHVEVQVTAHVDVVTFVGGLQFGTLLTTELQQKQIVSSTAESSVNRLIGVKNY